MTSDEVHLIYILLNVDSGFLMCDHLIAHINKTLNKGEKMFAKLATPLTAILIISLNSFAESKSVKGIECLYDSPVEKETVRLKAVTAYLNEAFLGSKPAKVISVKSVYDEISKQFTYNVSYDDQAISSYFHNGNYADRFEIQNFTSSEIQDESKDYLIIKDLDFHYSPSHPLSIQVASSTNPEAGVLYAVYSVSGGYEGPVQTSQQWHKYNCKLTY